MKLYPICWMVLVIIFFITGCATTQIEPQTRSLDLSCLANCDTSNKVCAATAENKKGKCLQSRQKSKEDCLSDYTDDKFTCSTDKTTCQQRCNK